MVRFGTVILFLGTLWAQQLPDTKSATTAPTQPIAYSHKLHAGQLKIECAQCHPVPGEGDYATYPATSKCMTCHKTIKTGSPEIAKLAAADAAGAPVEWVQVYRIADFVSFNHRKHLKVDGVTCENCHGPVKEREVLRREKDISMAACLECHRAKGGTTDCNGCHDPR